MDEVYSANKASFFTKADKEIAGVLVATDYKDPPLVAFIQEEDADSWEAGGEE